LRDWMKAEARVNSETAAASPRMVASSASWSSVRWSGAAPEPLGASEIDGLAFQCAGFRRRLLGRVLRFDWEIGGEPIDDAAFEAGGAVALTNEQRGDVRAGQFIRIRVVHHNLTIARECGRGAVAEKPDRSGQPNGAVLVRIFQTGVDEDGRSAAIDALFEIFFRNAGNGHVRYCCRAARGLSTRWWRS